MTNELTSHSTNMFNIQDAVKKLSDEFNETKNQLAQKDTKLAAVEYDLAEANRQLAEKNKQLEEMAAKLKQVEVQNTESSFLEKLNNYKQQMAKGIFCATYDEFYRRLDTKTQRSVAIELAPIIFHDSSLEKGYVTERSVGYKNVHAFSNAVRLYDEEEQPIKNWCYQNPIVYIPEAMAEILGLKTFNSANHGQQSIIIVVLDGNFNSCSRTKIRFINSTGSYSVVVNENVFNSAEKMKIAFNLKKLADQHNKQVLPELEKQQANFLEFVEKLRNANSSNKPSDKPSDKTSDKPSNKQQVDNEIIPKASEVASEVH